MNAHPASKARILLGLPALLLTAVVVLNGAPVRAQPSGSAGKVRVLVVTGGHDFEREPFFKMFRDNTQISFDAVEHPQAPARLKADAASQYDVIVLYDMWQPISDEAKADFVSRLKEGKGLVALHHCLASYQSWPEYRKIIGGTYYLEKTVVNGAEKAPSTYKHDVDFTVHIADSRHPVTRGLKDFSIHDETYGGFEVSPESHALLATDEATSSRTIAWAKAYDKARVVYLQLGHDHQAYENPSYRKFVAQAIRWTAGKD